MIYSDFGLQPFYVIKSAGVLVVGLKMSSQSLPSTVASPPAGSCTTLKDGIKACASLAGLNIRPEDLQQAGKKYRWWVGWDAVTWVFRLTSILIKLNTMILSSGGGCHNQCNICDEELNPVIWKHALPPFMTLGFMQGSQDPYIYNIKFRFSQGNLLTSSWCHVYI